MNIDAAEEIVFAHHAGTTTAFVRGGSTAGSSFGGPVSVRISGAHFGPHQLHQIGLIVFSDLHPALPPASYGALPLLYGMAFDGCDLSYRISGGEIDLDFITPNLSSDDWPYENYPTELPLLPLTVSRTWVESWDEFRAAVIPNLNEWATPKVTIVVPPPKTLGVSLWGPEGDAEGATIVFQYSHEHSSVRAFNLCS